MGNIYSHAGGVGKHNEIKNTKYNEHITTRHSTAWQEHTLVLLECKVEVLSTYFKKRSCGIVRSSFFCCKYNKPIFLLNNPTVSICKPQGYGI